MRKLRLFLIITLIIISSAASAESIWIEEEWQLSYQEIDCDGLPLIIDAKILQIQEDASVQEYHLERLSSTFMVEKGRQINWLLLGCDTSNGQWRKPTDSFPEYQFNGPSIFPACSINALCSLSVQNIDPYYIYHTNEEDPYNPNLLPINRLTEAKVKEYAEQVASACGYQLGNILRVYRGDDVDVVRGSIIKAIEKRGAEYSPDPTKAEEYLFIDVYYPIYYNGLRLYSGDYTSTPDLVEIPNMNMRMIVTEGHGIILVDSVMLDLSTLQPMGNPQSVISVEEAISAIQMKYSDMFLPGIKQIVVHQMALEYVPMTGDLSASKGFTLYPAWVIRLTMETDDGETYSLFEAYHAISGRPLF